MCVCVCACTVLSVLVWPLVVYHELIQKMYTGLEPILMKLDYSMKGDPDRRKHDKKSEWRPPSTNQFLPRGGPWPITAPHRRG